MASSPSSPLSPLVSIVPADSTNELKITDLVDLLQLLRRHGYSGVSYYRFALYLGLSPNTLDVIKKNNRDDVEDCLRECLTKWLQKADDVEKKGGPTIYSLVSALRRLGENGLAHGIDMEVHPACKSLAHYASNQSLLSALPQFVIVLYLAKLIKEMILPTNDLQGEALLHIVKEAVCNDYQKLEAFGQVLCKSTTTAEIGCAIMKEYREVFCIEDLIDDNVEGLKIYLPKSVTSQLKMLRLKFGQTFFKVGSIMMRNPQAPYIDNIKYVLRTYDEALRPQVSQCQDIRDILELVSDNSSLDDISMLEYFIDEFNIKEAKVVIQEYKEAVEEFKKTKLKDCLEEKFSKASPFECERITIVVDKDATQSTLKDVERLVSAILDNLSQHVRLNVIRQGNSFTITCSFSLILSQQLITVAQGNIAILRANQVKRLTIGYYTVYEVAVISNSATMESGLLKQLMLSMSIQLINGREERNTISEESMRMKELQDTKVKMLSVSLAESDEFKEKYKVLNGIKELLEEQFGLFQSEKEKELLVDITEDLFEANIAKEQPLEEKKEDVKHEQSKINIEVPASEVQQFFEDLNVKLPDIAKAFKDSASDVQELVSEAKDELKKVCESGEVKQIAAVKISYHSLRDTTEAVHTYLDKVNDLYLTLQNRTTNAIEDIEKGRFKSTEQLAAEINKTVQDCKQQYTKLLDCCKEFAQTCDGAERECSRLAREAESNQRTVRIAGGVTTAAVAASGVTASVLVGVFTFGVGFAIGLPLTLAATAATTAAAGATTQVLSYRFGKAAESFSILSKRFAKLQYNIATVQDMINQIDLSMNENTEIRNMTIAERKSLTKTMRHTLEETSGQLKVTAEVNESLTEEITKFLL